MKKFWLFILSVLLVLPIEAKAELYNVGSDHATGGAYFEGSGLHVTTFRYYMTNGPYANQTMYCIDGGAASPAYINDLSDLDINTPLGRAFATMFAAADAIGASTVTASDGARILTSFYSPNGYGESFWFFPYDGVYKDVFIRMLTNAGYTLAGLSPIHSTETTISKSSPNFAQLQKVFCAGVKAYGDTTSKVYQGCSSVNTPQVSINGGSSGNLTVNMYEDSTKTRRNEGSDRLFSQYVGAKVVINPVDAKITLTGCSVNNSNYECAISGSYLNREIANNEVIEVLVQNKNNNLNTDATQVNVNINYSYTGGMTYSIKQGTCYGSGCYNGYAANMLDQHMQRMLVISNKPGNSSGTAVLGVNVPKACQRQDNGYKVGNKTVTVREYMEYGCCSDVNVKDITNSDDLNYYKDTCMEDDVVEFSNVCGSSLGCLERDGYYQNNKYVGYSKSYIYQKSLNKVMKSVNNLESGAYKTNDLSNMYNESQISNNLDRDYASKLSSGNNYCMLYTSEDLSINFPGTTESISGRSFVFEELTKNECQTNPNASSKNCFRQPYVSGTLTMNFHTNVDRWLSDYQGAVSALNDARNKLNSATDRDAAQAEYDLANQRVIQLQNYKQECESYSDLRAKEWKYNLEPELTFYYDQKVYDKDDSPTITTKVTMVPSYNSVKYWPNVTGDTELSGGCNSGTASYNGFTYKTNKDCNYSAKRTVYYRPEKATYTLISTGRTELKTINYEHEETINQNGILIGYVYDTQISIEQGEYQTRFEIDKVGHNQASANIQKSYTKYKEENKDASGHLYSKCIYCNRASKTIRLCDTCPPSDQAIIYRSIATDNVTPQDRVNTNWSDVKGKTAERLIEANGGSKIISNVGDTYLALVTDLNDNNKNNNIEDKTIALNSSELADLYDDSTKEFLEYEITLTTKDMQIIKKNNNRASFNYSVFNICTNGKKVSKDENADYCFVCNSSGKECESSFIDAFSDDSTLLANTRANKWKYFYYDATDEVNPGKFISGSMKDYQSNAVMKKLFPDGKYPDPELVNAYLYVNKNWP